MNPARNRKTKKKSAISDGARKLITPHASDFGKVNVKVKQFPDTESYVLIPNIDSYKGAQVRIYHRLYPEPEKRFLELLLIINRLRKVTRNIEVFAPYLPYARQDRESIKGEAVSADILCELLKDCGVKKFITFDCHFLPKPGNFVRNGLRIENLSAGKALYTHAKKYFGKEKFIVISPDQGSSYFIENATGKHHNGEHSSFSLDKKRKRHAEHGLELEVDHVKGGREVKDMNICILDDIIATGGTLIRAIEHLKKLGAKRVICGATHGQFAGENIASKIMKSSCSHIFVANSIEPKETNKVEVVKLPKF